MPKKPHPIPPANPVPPPKQFSYGEFVKNNWHRHSKAMEKLK